VTVGALSHWAFRTDFARGCTLRGWPLGRTRLSLTADGLELWLCGTAAIWRLPTVAAAKPSPSRASRPCGSLFQATREWPETPQLSHSGSDGSPLIRDVHAQDGGTGCTTINAGADSRCFQAMWGNRWFVPGHRPEAGAGLARGQLGTTASTCPRGRAPLTHDFALGTAMKIDWN
jgi:hypothetical protein